MGSFEKLVVLTVIFLASVVLVVSFQTPADEGVERGANVARVEPAAGSSAAAGSSGEGSGGNGAAVESSGGNGAAVNTDRSRASERAGANPFGTGAAAQGDGGPAADAASPREAAAPSSLLSASGTDRRAPASTPTAPLTGYPPLVEDVRGLTAYPGQVGSYVYRVGAADRSWGELSDRFYGTSAHADVLRRENAAVGPPVPGQEILVPSSSMPAATAHRTRPFEPRGPGRPAPRTPKTEPGAGDVSADDEAGRTFRTHVVADGETLTAIAFRYYGRASLWTRIFDANRDVLPNENDLKIGMQLRIP